MQLRDEDIFEYHERPRPGKLEVRTSKPCLTQRDLSHGLHAGRRRALPGDREGSRSRRTTTPARATSSPSSATAPQCSASATSARSPASP